MFSVDLYCYFWFMRQYDIYWPEKQYAKVIIRVSQRKIAEAIN